MNNKLSGFLKNKPVFFITMIVAVLLIAVGIAALLGAFGDKEVKELEAIAHSDTAIVPEGAFKFMDSEIKINAEDSDSLGVAPTSTFKLVFSAAPDEKALSAALSVEPEQAFQLKKISAEEYAVEFENPLQGDSIYNISLSDNNTGAKKSWAFQTKKIFNVLRSLPRNKSVQVPANSGIEITFSHENVENAEQNFSISPKVEGRFEWHKKTLVFVPNKLEKGTVYTVTLKKGFGVKGSDETLSEDYTFSFQTVLPEKPEETTYFNFSDSIYSFTPKATPALQVYTQEDLNDTDVAVELYSYPNADSFLKDLKALESSYSSTWYLRETNNTPYDETKLKSAASVTGHIAKFQNNYWYSTFLVLPSSLSEGYYLVVAEVEGKKYYSQLQINNASVYIMKTEEKSLAWLNDSITGQPLSGAEFKLDTGKSVLSNQEGMAVLSETITEKSSIYFMIKPAAGLPYVAKVFNNTYQPYYDDYYNPELTDHYWRYLYLDKDMFLPEDTINIWGILKPRDNSSSETEAVLELVRYNYYSYSENNASVLTSQNVKIAPNGTYSGSLRIDGYNPGSYEVRVKVGEKVMHTRYLQVMDYSKPVYKMEVKRDRNYMYAWETVKFDILTSFYEGTPVSGIELDYSSSLSSTNPKNGVLVSDTSGAASLTLQPSTPESGWRPVYLNLDISNREAEELQIREYNSVTVFPKDTMIEVESKIENQAGTLDFTTSRIDLSKLEGKTSGYYSEEEYRGASVDIPVTAKLYERYYESRKTGDYYDYINKVSRDTYEYYEVQNLIAEYSFNTENGKHREQFTVQKDKNYYLEVTSKDSEGRSIVETQYIYNWNYYDPYDNRTYSLTGKENDYNRKLNELVSVEVKKNKQKTGDEENSKYLFIRLKNGILDYKVTASPVYDFSFDKEFIPNMYIKAVCFDGANIYDAGLLDYWYDSSEKELNISVKPDKESYKPGETVKLQVEVKDLQGKPYSADLNVSVVDEAFFSISQQYVDILSSLYGPNVSSGILADYFSYTSPEDATGSPMAEMGEGGDEYVRTDFKDSALFISATTGADGKAEASFIMPDNLTSWRITYQAVTEDLHAGCGKMNISSKLPFFVDTIFNKAFITGDNPSILMRSYGMELPEKAEVNYKVTLHKENGDSKTYNTAGIAHKPSLISLGSLEAGNYTIRIEAAGGDLKDAMERTFRVSDSLLETCKTDFLSLTESTSVTNIAKGLTSLVFYGEDSALLYNELQSLYWSWGQRLDQKLARKVSGNLLKNYFNEENYYEEEFDIRQYQTEDGGLALLTYDSSNPALSAKLSALAAEDVDRDALANYFLKLLEDSATTPEDAAYAYWGLAALKEPVLLDIQSILRTEGLTPEIRLILGVALAEIGDYQGAREIYLEMFSKSGTVTDTLAWVESGTRDESIDTTALCSLIALKTNTPEKIKIFRYIKSNSTSELLVNLERMMFVKNYIKDASLNSSFNYELDGVKKQIDLNKGSYYKLELTPEKLASIKFSNIQGKIGIASCFVAPVSELRKTEGTPVTIKRTYSSGSKTTSFDRSDTVKIVLSPEFSSTAPDGYYEITDVLPAGFRYVQAEYADGKENTWWYPDEVTGQKVVFGYYYNKKEYKSRRIVYYAKAVTPGTYTADNAAIKHTDNDISGFTEKFQITIQK